MTHAGYLALLLAISMSPAVEVRGSIPLAVALFDGPEELCAVAACVIGNLLIAPAVLAALEHVDRALRSSRFVPRALRHAYLRVLSSARSRGSRAVGRYGLLGLAAFVAIPLPGTGAWTGSIVAYVLGMSKVRAVIAIEAGVVAASAIVLLTTYLGLEAVKRALLIP